MSNGVEEGTMRSRTLKSRVDNGAGQRRREVM